MIIREALRFPSGTATANVIRTLFGIQPDAVPAEVPLAEPSIRAPPPTAPLRAVCITAPTPTQRGALIRSTSLRGGLQAGWAAGMPREARSMSRRCSNVEDTPYLDLKSAQELARADSSMTLGNAFLLEPEHTGAYRGGIL